MLKIKLLKKFIRLKSNIHIDNPVGHFNEQIKHYLEEKENHIAKQLFQDIMKNNLKPNDETISIFMDSYLKNKNFQNAQNFLFKIKKLKFEINEEEKLTKFFGLYLNSRGPKSCLVKLAEFESKTYKIPIIIYFRILTEFFRENKIKEALELYQKLSKNDKENNVYFVSVMMNNFTNKNMLQDSEEFYAKFVKENPSGVNTQLFNSHLNLLLKQKEFKKLENSFNNGSSKNLINVNSYQIIMNCFFQQNDLKNVMKYYIEMKKSNIKPNFEIYANFIEYFCSKREMEKSEHILNEMVENEIAPTIDIFNMFLEGYIDQWDEFLKIEKTIQSLKLSMNRRTFNLLIRAHLEKNNQNQIDLYIEKYPKFGIDKDNFFKLLELYIQTETSNDIINSRLLKKLPLKLSNSEQLKLLELLLSINNFTFVNKIIGSNEKWSEEFLNEFLKIFLKLNKIEEMKSTVMDMIKQKINIHFDVYYQYIVKLSEMSDLENAKSLFSWIPLLYNFNPPKELYLRMIKKYYENGNVKDATKLLNEMESTMENIK
eukprot:gene3145-5461_t